MNLAIGQVRLAQPIHMATAPVVCRLLEEEAGNRNKTADQAKHLRVVEALALTTSEEQMPI